MIIEKPLQLKIEHILPFFNIIPGFFSLATYGLLLDVFSAGKYPANWLRDPIVSSGKIGIIIILFATILDLIISIIHHLTTEKIFYKFGHELKENTEIFRAFFPNCPFSLGRFYIYDDKDLDKHNCLKNTKYRYSVFWGKMFISLPPFAIVAYFDLPEKLEISQDIFLLFVFVVFITAYACLKVSYEKHLCYMKEEISLICKNLNPEYYIKLEVESILYNKSSNDSVFVLKPTIYGIKSEQIIELKDLNINFRTTLGDIIQKDDGNGRVAILRSNKCGKAIIIATADKCIPGILTVSCTPKVDKYSVFFRSLGPNPRCNNTGAGDNIFC